MLMPRDVGAAAAAPALGNFYFGPVGLRPVFEPAYLAEASSRLKSRSKPNSKLDLTLDVKPRSRHVPVKGKNVEVIDVDSNSNDHRLVEDDSKLREDDEDADSESEPTTAEPKKDSKKHHTDKKKKKPNKLDSALEHWCPKLRVSIVLAILGTIVLVACCCALFLRNRIVKCLKKCCPKRFKKKDSNKDLFDVEEGGYPYQSSRKTSFKKSSKKKKGNPRMIDTGTQDSRTSMAKPQEEAAETVGCSPCCRKKKKQKKSDKKRRK